MTDITRPLTLWKGSHEAGSGRGCAMNVVSWENGDTTITDFPSCSDRMLARLVQGVNDRLADADGRLAPADALVALELGHATVGTSAHGLSDLELRRVYVRCAVLAARKVVHLDRSGTALAAIQAAEVWADHPTSASAYASAAYAASAAAAYASASAAASAASAAATSAASASAAASAASAAAAASAYASASASAREFYAPLAAEIIALFRHLTGTGQPEPAPSVVQDALDRMAAIR